MASGSPPIRGWALNIIAIYIITLRELKRFLRQKSRLIGSLGRPLFWLLVVGSGLSQIIQIGGGISYMQFILPGILGLTILFSAMFSSLSIIWDREFGFLKEILVAPISRLSIVLGKVMGGTMVSTLQAVLIMILIPLLRIPLGLMQVVSLLLVAVMISFALTSFGVLVASLMHSLESFNLIINFLIMPMFFVSGALYPIKLLPPPIHMLARLNPLSYGVDAFKNVLLKENIGSPLSPEFPFYQDIVFVLGFTGLMLVLATLVFSWRRD
jgi:ABC-2 type transport system permease protein